MGESSKLDAAAKAARDARRATEARDDAIRKAAAGGDSLRAIARAVGLSHQRVHQIVHGR